MGGYGNGRSGFLIQSSDKWGIFNEKKKKWKRKRRFWASLTLCTASWIFHILSQASPHLHSLDSHWAIPDPESMQAFPLPFDTAPWVTHVSQPYLITHRWWSPQPSYPVRSPMPHQTPIFPYRIPLACDMPYATTRFCFHCWGAPGQFYK